MKCVPPDGFFGIQILPNSISATGELTTLLQTLWSPSTHSASSLRAFGTEKPTLEVPVPLNQTSGSGPGYRVT